MDRSFGIGKTNGEAVYFQTGAVSDPNGTFPIVLIIQDEGEAVQEIIMFHVFLWSGNNVLPVC